MKNAYSGLSAKYLFFLAIQILVSQSVFAQTYCDLGSFTINVAKLSPQITGNSLICPGSSTQLQVSQNFNSYTWSTGVNSPSITVNAPGDYTVTVSNSTGCTASDTHTVSLAPSPVVAIAGNLSLCTGGSTVLTATSGYSHYSWTGGSTDSTFSTTTAGTYIVTVTSANGCTASASAVVTVSSPSPPSISGILQFCQGDSTAITAQGAGYTSFVWSNGKTTQGIQVSIAGNYTVTATNSSGCTGTASATFQSIAPPNASITGSTSFCSGDSTLLVATGNFPNYLWSNGLTGDSITVVQAGIYSVTVSNAQGCTSTASAMATVNPLPTVEIAPVTGVICDSEAPFNLSASPAGGEWGGNVGTGGWVNPATLGVGAWTASYEFTDANGCAASDQLNFEIMAGTASSIAPAGPFCPTAGVQTLTGTPAGGSWGGSANPMGEFDPSALGPGVYTVTYSSAATGNCSNIVQIAITVSDAPLATMAGSGIICEGSGQTAPISITAAGNGPFEVIYSVDGGISIPVNLPAGTTNINVPATGVYEIVSITDAGGCVGSGSGQAVVTAVAGPIAANIGHVCDAAQSSYQVVFELSGGDPASYFVNSAISGSLSSGPPFIFTSDLIASGSNYQFEASDANGCVPALVSGSFNCNCATSAGSLDGTPLALCMGETAVAQPNGNAQLGPNDILLYYLHDGNSNSLGTVFGTSQTPSFDFAPPLVAGQTYYISAVAGVGDGSGGIDLSDPCLAVSFGTPVTWYATPSGSLSGGASICEGETTDLAFSLNGAAPFNVAYSDGSQTLTLLNIPDGHSIAVSPASTTTFTLVSVEDGSPAGCTASPGNSVTIVVHAPDSTVLNGTSCIPAEAGVFTDVFTNQNGCDSTVILTVTYQPFDEVFQEETTCDPTMAGVFVETLTNQFGCDSVVTTTVALLPSDMMALTTTTCDTDLAGIFTEIFTNQYGCDSVVVTTVTLLSPNECNVSFQLAAAVIPCGSQEGSISIEVELGQFPLAYHYSGPGGINGSGSMTSSPFSLPPLPAGQYTVTLTNPNGLSSTATIEIVQATPPTVTIELLNGLPCSGEPLAALSANVSGAFPPYSLLWSNGATTPTISNLGAGNFELVVTGDYGCEATAAISIDELPNFEIGFTVSHPDCFENNIGSVTVDVTGGQPPYLFSLNNGVFQPENYFDNLAVGAYQIVVTDGNGCKKTASFAIHAPLIPEVSLGNDMTIDAGDGVSIVAIVNLPDSLIASISWEGLGPSPECPTCLVQQTVPLVTSTYSIVVESVDGCTDSDDLTVYVKKNRPVYVPSAFSPDGDGINDVFYPFSKNNSVEKINSFYVFSRWGESVFSAADFQPNDPTHGWDGTHKGQALNAGVFVWFAEITFKDGDVVVFEGDVTLLR